jgi:hypothetical protein
MAWVSGGVASGIAVAHKSGGASAYAQVVVEASLCDKVRYFANVKFIGWFSLSTVLADFSHVASKLCATRAATLLHDYGPAVCEPNAGAQAEREAPDHNGMMIAEVHAFAQPARLEPALAQTYAGAECAPDLRIGGSAIRAEAIIAGVPGACARPHGDSRRRERHALRRRLR